MKTFLALSIFWIGTLTLRAAESHQINCHDILEGEEVGGKFETTVKFNSVTPTLEETLAITLTGQSTKTTKSTYLSPAWVCGLPIDFAKSCTFQEKLGSFGYSFTFKCGNEITRGEIYCDENCFTTESMATFRCQGPKVDKKLSSGGLVYLGCKHNKEE